MRSKVLYIIDVTGIKRHGDFDQMVGSNFGNEGMMELKQSFFTAYDLVECCCHFFRYMTRGFVLLLGRIC